MVKNFRLIQWTNSFFCKHKSIKTNLSSLGGLGAEISRFLTKYKIVNYSTMVRNFEKILETDSCSMLDESIKKNLSSLASLGAEISRSRKTENGKRKTEIGNLEAKSGSAYKVRWPAKKNPKERKRRREKEKHDMGH